MNLNFAVLKAKIMPLYYITSRYTFFNMKKWAYSVTKHTFCPKISLFQ